MWGRKIVYILLVIITSYIALMYESPVPGVFLAFELLLPIALFALTWYHKKNVKVTIGNGQQVANTITPTSIRAAVTIVASAPILVVYPFLQKYFVKGVTLGATKG